MNFYIMKIINKGTHVAEQAVMTLIIVTILQNSIAFNAVQVQHAQNLCEVKLSSMNRFQIFVGIKTTFLHSKLHVPVQLSSFGMSCT